MSSGTVSRATVTGGMRGCGESWNNRGRRLLSSWKQRYSRQQVYPMDEQGSEWNEARNSEMPWNEAPEDVQTEFRWSYQDEEPMETPTPTTITKDFYPG
jgi:hypothetical protein